MKFNISKRAKILNKISKLLNKLAVALGPGDPCPKCGGPTKKIQGFSYNSTFDVCDSCEKKLSEPQTKQTPLFKDMSSGGEEMLPEMVTNSLQRCIKYGLFKQDDVTILPHVKDGIYKFQAAPNNEWIRRIYIELNRTNTEFMYKFEIQISSDDEHIVNILTKSNFSHSTDSWGRILMKQSGVENDEIILNTINEVFEDIYDRMNP